eukprot:g3711.t1
MIMKLLPITIAALAITSGWACADYSKKEIRFEECPEIVREAITSGSRDGRIDEIDLIEVDGKRIYIAEVELPRDKDLKVYVNGEGDLLKTLEEVSGDDVPGYVSDAVGEFGGHIDEVEKETAGDVVTYHVDVERAGKPDMDVVVSATAGTMKLLIVEDSPRLRVTLGKSLSKMGYAVDMAEDGYEGDAMARASSYDVIVLDRMLPGKDGLEVLRDWRREGIETPVLLLTALDGTEEKVRGLGYGADDYLTKPFALEELAARLEALARRFHAQPNPVVELGGLEIDFVSKSVSRNGTPLNLSARLLVVTGMGVFLGMKELLNERFNETLEAKAMALVTASEVDDGEFEVDMTVQDFAGFGVGGDDFFEIRRKGGGLVLRSPSMKFHGRVVERFARLPVARATGALVFDDQLANGEAARFYVRMIYPKDDFEDRFQDVYLIVGSPTRGIHRDLRLLGTVLLVAGGLAILLIPPLVGIGLGRGLKPLKVFSTEIGEIRADRLEQRLEIAQIPKELAPVAEGLNAWLDRLEESFERERRFSANAAHELRTPLSELRSMAELGARWADEATPERCREMVSVTQEMGDLIERLSLLARADAGQQGIRIERMKVGEIANAGLLRFREMAEERGISMSTRVIDGEFCSDRVLWMAIFANMVGNAVSHAPRGSEIGITGLEGGVGGDELVIRGGVVGFGADLGEEILEGGLVFIGDEVRLGDDGGAVFKIDEAVWAIEFEADFLWIHEVEERDVVLAVAQVLEGFGEFGGVGEEVGKNDDEGALADFFGDGVKGGDEAGLAGGFDVFDGGEKAFQMRGAARGWDFEVELVRADREAGGVALVHQEIGEGCGDPAGVFDLRFLPGAVKIHGAGGVDDEVGAEVGIRFEFLDVEAIGTGEGFPVEPAGIIAGNVFPVFGEFDRGSADLEQISNDLGHHEGVLSVQPLPGRSAFEIEYDPGSLSHEDLRTIAEAHIPSRILQRRTMRLDGAACEACAFRLERKLSKIPGVRKATATYLGKILCLTFDDRVSSEAAVMDGLEATGARVRPYSVPAAAGNPSYWEKIRGGKLNEEISCGLGFVFLLISLIFEHTIGKDSAVTWGSYLVAYVFSGQQGVRSALASLREKVLDVDVLMVLAAVGAAIVGQPFEGALLLFLFSFSNVLQSYALQRTQRAIHSLLQLRPEHALVKREGGTGLVRVEEIGIGEVVLVRPGELIPVDGTLTEGRTNVDESSLTGEPMPVSKEVGMPLFAGTLNQSGGVELTVTKRAEDSTLARMVKLVEEAQAEKSGTQRFLERAEQYYASGVIFLTAVVMLVPWFFWNEGFSTAFYRAMTVMVVASPCALIISTPATVLSAIGGAARRGILIKGGSHLESAAKIDIVALDKTGTLTFGRPVVTDLVTGGGVFPLGDELPGSGAELLAAAAALEEKSEHPLATAIVNSAQKLGLDLPDAVGFQSTAGKGAEATVGGRRLVIGSERLLLELSATGMDALRAEIAPISAKGSSCVWIGAREGDAVRAVGVLVLADTIRPEAIGLAGGLRRLGVKKVVMLTGDGKAVAQAIGAQAGIDEVHAELLPEGKVELIRELKKQGRVLMIGDGVNDAPALATADLGVAMGAAGTDIAMETADVVLMGDKLENIPMLLGIARHSKRVLIQNLTFASAIIVVLVLAALSVGIPLPLGVVGHEGSTVLVCLNGLRLLFYRPALP